MGKETTEKDSKGNELSENENSEADTEKKDEATTDNEEKDDEENEDNEKQPGPGGLLFGTFFNNREKTKMEIKKKRKWMKQRTKRQKIKKLQRKLLMTGKMIMKRQQKKMMISRKLKEEYCLEHSSTIWRNLIKQTEKLQRMIRRRKQRIKIQKLQTWTRSKQFTVYS